MGLSLLHVAVASSRKVPLNGVFGFCRDSLFSKVHFGASDDSEKKSWCVVGL